MRPLAARARVIGAVALGLFLAAVPFMRYRFGSAHPTAHADHMPHHGGILGMVGDMHLEVVRGVSTIEVYPSDAYRRPVRATGGQIVFVDGSSTPLVWDGERLVARDDQTRESLTCVVTLADGHVARMSVEF